MDLQPKKIGNPYFGPILSFIITNVLCLLLGGLVLVPIPEVQVNFTTLFFFYFAFLLVYFSPILSEEIFSETFPSNYGRARAMKCLLRPGQTTTIVVETASQTRLKEEPFCKDYSRARKISAYNAVYTANRGGVRGGGDRGRYSPPSENLTPCRGKINHSLGTFH